MSTLQRFKREEKATLKMVKNIPQVAKARFRTSKINNHEKD